MHYKYLFLAMSCNEDFFEVSRRTVHSTWARDIIGEKYPNVGFFSYTTAKDYKERIVDNCIYVNTPDDIFHTYSKSIRALQLLKANGVTWDYLVRTNTSTFFNVHNTLSLLDTFDKTKMYSFCPGKIIVEEDSVILPTGWFMTIPAKLTDYLIENYGYLNEESEYMGLIQRYLDNGVLILADDVLFGLFRHVINKLFHENIELVDLSREYIKHYKTNVKNVYIQPKLDDSYNIPSEYVDDPREILSLYFVQMRKFCVELSKRYIECEEMYELQSIIDNESL